MNPLTPLRPLSLRAEVLVDQNGFRVRDPSTGSVVGWREVPIFTNARVVFALASNTQSGFTARYKPSKHPEEISLFGMDFSKVIPPGVGIFNDFNDPDTLPGVILYTNTVPPVVVAPLPGGGGEIDFGGGGVIYVIGRAVYVSIKGGVAGTDYIVEWYVTDTNGWVHVRDALMLCADTS